MNTKHGVLMSGHSAVEEFSVGVYEGRILFHTPVQGNITLHKLCTLAMEQGLTHLWVLPHETILNTRNSYFLDASGIDWDLKYTWELEQEMPGRENHLRSVYGWGLADDRHAFYIIFIGPYAGWEFARNPDITPKELLWVVAHIEHELTIPITASPGTTGKNYLESLHPLVKKWFEPATTKLDTLPFNLAARPLVWTREPTPEELGKKYAVKIDKNSAYPRAGVEYKFGVGEVYHYAPPSMTEPEMRVGIWHIKEVLGDRNPLLPKPLFTGQEWVTTPQLKRLYAMGLSVTIDEGWYFPECFHVFQKWAENLWEIRSKYQPGDLRRDAFKQVLTDTVGIYRSKKVSFPRRPDWTAQFIGGCYATMLQNCESFAKKWGLYPVIVSTDAIVYCTDQEVLSDEREKLGWYKHVWRLEMTEEVKAILTGPGNGAMKMGKLNKLAKVAEDDE